MSTTKSTPEAPKIVIARYDAPERAWKIPLGLDLEDKSIVKKWWVDCYHLHIEYTDGRHDLLESAWETEADFKYQEDERIGDAEELCIDFDKEIEKFHKSLEKAETLKKKL